ncbi:condensation protein [Streptomyces sp. HSG2]|uniref:condensation protein n=1 Tax=Streptomyces sp. HSG2 TaxID=2797167 RepID=UPI001F5B87F5|nr:condensation protein [Streptomyces sp. HSG2]
MSTAPTRVPFPVVDEISRHCHHRREPETIHIEIRLPGPLDPARLREAFAGALERHPRALMREAEGPWFRRRYEWELTDTADVDVVRVAPPGPDALGDARARALARVPPLSAAPPIRLEVVAGEAGTVLLLGINHTALDGPACLRLLATTAELYGGRDNTPAAHPVRAVAQSPPVVRDLATPAPWSRPARVAPGAPGAAPGDGVLVAELALPGRPAGAGYTVNDQLMVATALTVAQWNREHGARPRPLRITMPVDDRPRDSGMPIGNGTRLVDVPFTVAELRFPTLPDLLRRTAARTRDLKARPRPQLGRGAALLTTPWAPVACRAVVTRAVRRACGPWTSTTLLSNIGRVPYPLDFGEEAGRARAVWLSAPARAPRGLTFTTASTGGLLHLSVRWSRSVLGDEDGARVGDLFAHHLAATEAAS